MRFKLFALGLLLSAAVSPVAAEWNSGTLTLSANNEGDPTGKTTYIWAAGIKGTFAVRFDYDNIEPMKGRPFSDVGVLNCDNNKRSDFYWNAGDLNEEDAVNIVNSYAETICENYKRIYPDSPALK